ncbi:MAG: hypothetical protein AAFQ61_04965, partial [Cyanobacteria bacterium J06626_23]
LRKLLKHIVKTRQLITREVVTACERTLLIHSLISPFYAARTRVSRPLQSPLETPLDPSPYGIS